MKPANISFRSIPEASGKFFVEATSAMLTGKVIGSLPEGFTFPDRISATVLPPSCPACQANRMASGSDFQLAVSITPPIFKITTTFFPSLWKASETDWINARSFSVRLKSPSIFRSWNSPELRPIVTKAISASFALAASPAASGTNSGIRGWLKKAAAGLVSFGCFAFSSVLYFSYKAFTSASMV